MGSVDGGGNPLGTKISVEELDFTPLTDADIPPAQAARRDQANTFTQNQTVQGTLTLSGAFAHTGSTFGVFSATPVVKQAAVTGVNGSTVDNIYGAAEADVINSLRTTVNQLIARLQAYGFLP